MPNKNGNVIAAFDAEALAAAASAAAKHGHREEDSEIEEEGDSEEDRVDQNGESAGCVSPKSAMKTTTAMKERNLPPRVHSQGNCRVQLALSIQYAGTAAEKARPARLKRRW